MFPAHYTDNLSRSAQWTRANSARSALKQEGKASRYLRNLSAPTSVGKNPNSGIEQKSVSNAPNTSMAEL